MSAPDNLIPLPEPWLDDEACLRLNQLFYGGHPAEYIETRLHLLMIEAARPDLRRDALAEGLEWRKLTFKSKPDTELDESAHSAFVYADAVNLLHHAGETLLRIYLAHEPDENNVVPKCPWIEIATEKIAGGFKDRVRARFDAAPLDDVRRRAVERVFYSSKAAAGDEHAADVDESVDEIEDWLNHTARRFLDQARLFNSIKHGLAVQATESYFSIGPPEAPQITQDGPAIRFLDREKELEHLWRIETLWVAPEQLIAETWFILNLLSQVLDVGRGQYLNDWPEELQFIKRGALRDQLDSAQGDGVMMRLGWGPGYRIPYQRPLTCSVCGRAPGPNEERRVFQRWMAWHRPGDRLVRPVCPTCVPPGLTLPAS